MTLTYFIGGGKVIIVTQESVGSLQNWIYAMTKMPYMLFHEDGLPLKDPPRDLWVKQIKVAVVLYNAKL